MLAQSPARAWLGGQTWMENVRDRGLAEMHQPAVSLLGRHGSSQRKDFFAPRRAFRRGHKRAGCASMNKEPTKPMMGHQMVGCVRAVTPAGRPRRGLGNARCDQSFIRDFCTILYIPIGILTPPPPLLLLLQEAARARSDTLSARMMLLGEECLAQRAALELAVSRGPEQAVGHPPSPPLLSPPSLLLGFSSPRHGPLKTTVLCASSYLPSLSHCSGALSSRDYLLSFLRRSHPPPHSLPLLLCPQSPPSLLPTPTLRPGVPPMLSPPAKEKQPAAPDPAGCRRP